MFWGCVENVSSVLLNFFSLGKSFKSNAELVFLTLSINLKVCAGLSKTILSIEFFSWEANNTVIQPPFDAPIMSNCFNL